MGRATDARWPAALCAITLIVSSATAASDLAARPQSDNHPTAAAQVPAHLACMSALAQILNLKSAAAEAIRRDDLQALAKLHEDVDARLRAARLDMDRAFLTGAWQSPAARQRAAELLGQLEGVQMLNFIGLAFLKGYDNPTGKVSLSISDANDKMFMQLGQLVAALDMFNATVKRRADSGRR